MSIRTYNMLRKSRSKLSILLSPDLPDVTQFQFGTLRTFCTCDVGESDSCDNSAVQATRRRYSRKHGWPSEHSQSEICNCVFCTAEVQDKLSHFDFHSSVTATLGQTCTWYTGVGIQRGLAYQRHLLVVSNKPECARN